MRGDDPGGGRGGGRLLAGSERRVWVFTNEVKDGTWGGFGKIISLPDIYELVLGDGKGREAAEQVLAERRREEAELLLAAAGDQPVA